jgi:hypothetical protein
MKYRFSKALIAGLAVLSLFGSAAAFETSSSSYALEMISFPNGGGRTASSQVTLSFSVVGENFATLQIPTARGLSLLVGQGNLLSSLDRIIEEERWWISDIFARQDILGEVIYPQIWQTDTDPYFSWSVLLNPSSLVKGFSFSLDSQPDDSIDTQETFVQYPSQALSSGKHIFYVTPVDLQNISKPDSTKSFEIWIDVIPPSVSTLQPASGAILSDNRMTLSCVLTDRDSGINPSLTQFILNGHTLAITYNQETGLLTTSQEAALSEGNNAVLVKAYDMVSNMLNQGWNFIVDTYPPQGSVRINNGAEVAHSAYVTLNLEGFDATTGIAAVFVSNDGVFDSEYNAPFGFKTLIENWLLAAPDVDGVKTVFVKFKDTAGNISPAYSDQITLRRLVPETRIIAGPQSVTAEATADFRYEASRAESVFSYSIDNQPWSEWSSITSMRLSGFKEGNHYFSVKSAYDANDNGSIELDEEDATPAQWVWTVKAEGVIEQLKEKILFWRR